LARCFFQAAVTRLLKSRLFAENVQPTETICVLSDQSSDRPGIT
jgi:hypothetical protein